MSVERARSLPADQETSRRPCELLGREPCAGLLRREDRERVAVQDVAEGPEGVQQEKADSRVNGPVRWVYRGQRLHSLCRSRIASDVIGVRGLGIACTSWRQGINILLYMKHITSLVCNTFFEMRMLMYLHDATSSSPHVTMSRLPIKASCSRQRKPPRPLSCPLLKETTAQNLRVGPSISPPLRPKSLSPTDVLTIQGAKNECGQRADNLLTLASFPRRKQ